MNTLTLPTEDNHIVIRCQPARIYIDGARHRDLQLITWDVLPAPDFGKVMLTVAAMNSTGDTGRIENRGELPAIGASVVIRPPHGSGGLEFIGYVTSHEFKVEQDTEQVFIECAHHLKADLGDIIADIWQFDGLQAVKTSQATVKFNTDLNSLASSSMHSIAGRTCRVFDSSIDAATWTVADAIEYLLAAAVPSDVEIPSQTEIESLAAGIELNSLDITGKSAIEALVSVAKLAGLEIRSARTGRGLVLYRPGVSGKVHNVALQLAGSSLSTTDSNLWRGRILIQRRPSRCGVLALGAPKQYESTFELSPGWDSGRETSRWRDFVRSESDDWQAATDVYRKWVLNEHGWYCQNPWNLAVYNFAGISVEDFTVRSARSFLPCLSTDLAGQSLGVVAEIKCGSGKPWRRWRGPLWVSKDECAVYLGGDGLPGEYFQAVVGGSAQVRVTAALQADARLVWEVDGDPNTPREVIDASKRAGWKQVHTASIFAGSQNVGTPLTQDDSQLIRSLAIRRAQVVSEATDAKLTLGWIDTSCHVGDIVERIDGRSFELASNPDSRPSVRSVRHEFGESQTTHLIVSG